MRYKTNESQRGQADSATFRLAQFLGVFGIMLGVGELIWGGVIARHTGLEGYEWLVRVYGGRETARHRRRPRRRDVDLGVHA
jgi:hypothetical protein